MAKSFFKNLLKLSPTEQKIREITFPIIKLYLRRIEYAFFITLMFVFLGYCAKAISLRSLDDFYTFQKVMDEIFNDIFLNITPLTIIFAILVLIVFYILYPVVVRTVIFIIVIPTTIFLVFSPENIREECISLIIDFILLLGQYILSYQKIIIICFSILLLVSIIFSKKIRKHMIKIVKHSTELSFVAWSIYFCSIYNKYAFLNLIKDYYSIFRNGVLYLQRFTDIFVLLYLFLIFYFILASVSRALKFFRIKIKRLKAYLKIRKNMDNDLLAKNIKNITKKDSINKFHFFMLPDEELPPIEVIIPAYNEELTVVKTVKSVYNSNYPKEKLNTLVVSDGSTDNTAEVMINAFKMEKLSSEETKLVYNNINHKPILEAYESRLEGFENLRLLIKKNGGKFDALNVGLQYAPEFIKCVSVLDSDTTVHEDSFRILATEFVKKPNTAALAGIILPRDEFKWYQFKKIALTVWQYFDYISSFHVSRGGLTLNNSMMIVSGAFGFFSREVLLNIGGYKKSLGEDINLTQDIQKLGKYLINYIPEAVAYTQVPTTLSMLRKQRMRWFKGLTEALHLYKKDCLKNNRMKNAYKEFRLVEWITPLLGFTGFLIILAKPEMLQNLVFQIAIGLAIGISLFQSLVAFYIEMRYRRVKFWKLLYLPFSIIMSPLTVLWRNDGILDYSSKSWGKMKRS